VSTGIIYEGGDGSSMDKAVIIKTSNHAAGVGAEYIWIRNHFPGLRQITQALLRGENGEMYDRMECTTPKGETRVIYFDITDFFGKK